MSKLERAIWKKELTVNNKQVDKEHKVLFEIYNDLVSMIELNKGREEFARILSKMTDYSLYHFKREEEYMRKISYPKITNHQKFHRAYSYKIAMYNVKLMSNAPPDPYELLKYLSNWWLNHITTSDLDYERYKKGIKSEVVYPSY